MRIEMTSSGIQNYGRQLRLLILGWLPLNKYNIHWRLLKKPEYIYGLVQDCSNSIANALELLQSCTKPSIYFQWKLWLQIYQMLVISYRDKNIMFW